MIILIVYLPAVTLFSLICVQAQCLAPGEASVQAKESAAAPDQVLAQAEKTVLCIPFAK